MTKTKAASYAGALPLNTSLGEGIDQEDFERWMQLNHLAFAQMGWGGDGVFEGVDVDQSSYFTPDRLARFTGPVRGRRAKSGGAYTLRVEAFGSKFDLRITRTPLDGGASTFTYTGSTSGTTEQWVEVDVPLPDDLIYWLTLEVKSATTDGIVRQIAASEPEIDTGVFP